MLFRSGSLPEENWKKYTATNKQTIVDDVVKDLIVDFKNEDYTVLDELLGFLSEEELRNSITEEWKMNSKASKYNL